MKLKATQLLGFIMSILPLGVYVGINFEQYAPSSTETVKLGIGGAVVGFIFLMKALKKMNLPRGLFGWVLALAIAWLLQAILTDIVNLLMMAVAGEVGDELFIQPQVNRMMKAKDTNELASAIVKAQSNSSIGRV